MSENKKKPFYKTRWGIFLIILFLPFFLLFFIFSLWVKASKTIWQKDWKMRYRVGSIATIWSLLFIMPAFSGSPSTETLGAKTEKAELRTEVTQKPTVLPIKNTPVPINTPTIAPIPTNTPIPTIAIPTKIYVPPTIQPTTYNPHIQDNTNTAPTTSNTSTGYSRGDKDCGDFSSHAEAQSFFISQGGPASDPHRLDGDNDGSACETLP